VIISVTGGVEHVGAVAVKRLIDEGHALVVLDNLIQGHRNVVPDNAALFIRGNIRQSTAR
jgi:UDP-glucose 4-epimerase